MKLLSQIILASSLHLLSACGEQEVSRMHTMTPPWLRAGRYTIIDIDPLDSNGIEGISYNKKPPFHLTYVDSAKLNKLDVPAFYLSKHTKQLTPKIMEAAQQIRDSYGELHYLIEKDN